MDHRIRHVPRLSRRASAFAAIAVSVGVTSARDAHAISYAFSNPNGGAVNVSTNFTPVGVPGANDTIAINGGGTLFTGLTLTLPVNQSVRQIAYNHFGQTTINGTGVLTLGAGSFGGLAFNDGIATLPGQALTSLFLNAPIAGTELLKTGPGFVLLGANANSYTGGTTIQGYPTGGATRRGGVTVTNDAQLGAAGTAIRLTGGGVLRAASTFTTARPIQSNYNGLGAGVIESFGNLTVNSAITGSGGIIVSGFTGGSVTFGSLSTNTSDLTVAEGATATLLGTVAGNVAVTGTFSLGTSTTGPATNAIADASRVTSNGANVSMFAGATNVNEAVDVISFARGSTTLTLNANVNAGVQLAANSTFLIGTAYISGRDLGSGPLAANRALFTVADTSGLGLSPASGGGATLTSAAIAPRIIGNANVIGGVSQLSAVDAGFVTYGPYGIRPLAANEYATSLGLAAGDNVRISDGVATQNAPVTMNSLIIRDTMSSAGLTGVTGTGTLAITSGALAAVSDLAGEELFIDNPINFGAAAGVIHTTPTADGSSSLTLRGAILGTNGFTKAGNGELVLSSANSSYTGFTRITGGALVIEGNVPASGNGPLGAATNIIQMSPGQNDNQYTQLLLATPGATFARQITVLSGSGSSALIGTRGGGGTFSSSITVTDGYLNVAGGDDPNDVVTFSGNIFGGGGLQEPDVAAPTFQIIRITGGNGTTTGTIIRGGQWQAGATNSFGSGTIFFAGNKTATPTGGIAAYGGPRVIYNDLLFRAAPVFSGTEALTFGGPVDLGSVNREVFVTNAADTTFQSLVARGGLIKRGSGRLILGHDLNSYNGQTIAFEGSLRITAGGALGVAAGTANPNQGTFIIGNGVLELAGGITTPEAIYLGSGGVPISAANPTGNLRNVAGNNTITEAISFDNVGTVGVDAGSTLTLSGATLDNTVNGTAALRKVGAGTLAVRNVKLSTLDVQAGTVSVTPAGAPVGTSRVSSLSVASGATLDLTNNSLILDYTATSPQTAVRALLADGRIDTSAAGGVNTAVGYAEASGLFPGATFPQTFAGEVFDSSTFILVSTLAGDATLNKVVDFDDLLALARNYGGTGKVWLQGDVDYDADVDFDDLLALARTYSQTAPGEAILAFDESADFAADWVLAQSIVPEPMMALAATPLALLSRRRRR